MTRSQVLKKKMWRAHVEGANADPAGVKAYCRKNFINAQSLYGWRKRIEEEDTDAKSENAFMPVVVEDDHRQPNEFGKYHTMPDPKWVAEFIRHLFSAEMSS